MGAKRMARTLLESKIAGRTDRRKLKPRDKPYWRSLDPDTHLGYRRAEQGGRWVVRWRTGPGYTQRPLGVADDEIREGALDFDAAVRAARQLVEAERRMQKAAAAGPALTVASAVETYAAARDARDSKRKKKACRSDARSRLERYVIGRQTRGKRNAIAAAPLADIPLHELSESDLIAWRSALPDTLKGATKQRLINDLKAALNTSYRNNRSRLPASLPAAIQHSLRADRGEADSEPVARDGQILSNDEVRRLIQAAREIDEERAWDGDLFRMVALLAATGARFSQIARLRVGDALNDPPRLIVPSSWKGRGNSKPSIKCPVLPEILDALQPVMAGRASGAPLLERWRSKQVPGSIRWERAERGEWRSASELTRPWDAIRRRAGMKDEVVAYSLRHSSIVRALRLNQPTRLVAQQHDTSVAIIERHYGRFISDGLDELAARAAVPLL